MRYSSTAKVDQRTTQTRPRKRNNATSEKSAAQRSLTTRAEMRALRRVRGSTRTDVRPDRFIAVVTTEHLGEVNIRAYRAFNSPLVVEFPSDPGSASIPSTLKKRCYLTPPRPSEEKPGNTSATKSSAEKSWQTEPHTMEPKPTRAISGVTVGESLDAKIYDGLRRRTDSRSSPPSLPPPLTVAVRVRCTVSEPSVA